MCEFENNQTHVRAYSEGLFLITSHKKLKHYLTRSYIESIDGKILEPDYSKSNILFFSGNTGGNVPFYLKSYRRNGKYIFVLHVKYGPAIQTSLVYINQYAIIPKNVKTEDIQFLICESKNE